MLYEFKDVPQQELPHSPGNLCNCLLSLSLCLSVASFVNPHVAHLSMFPSVPLFLVPAHTCYVMQRTRQPKNHMSHLTGKTAQLITNQCNTSVEERRVCQNVNKAAKPLFAVDRRLLSVRGGLAISQMETKWSRLMTALTATATTTHE